jgi:translation initiation factor 2B subunit (eIF-2B alpha/beta/delta family)
VEAYTHACQNLDVAELAERVEELRANQTNGGSWLARRAVEALLGVVEEPAASTEEFLQRLLEAGRELATARPSQGAVAAAVGRLVASAYAASHLPPEQLQRLVSEEANALVAGRDRAAASIAVHLAPQLADATVMTHSASATVREAVLHGSPARVLCTVSAPYEEGRLLADELRAEGVAAEVVEDDRVADGLASASLVLVGADTVYEDGSVKNKIGTRALAEGAAANGVRVLVACELLKLAPTPPPAQEDEPGLRDLTPPELIDKVVTEEGPCSPEDVLPLIDRTPFLRDGYRLLFG